MRFLEVHLSCQLVSEACFPAYAGSMLRGALGAQLRRALCVTRKSDCPSCLLATGCLFPRLFTACPTPQEADGAPLLPPPFCLEPGCGMTGVKAADDTFSFTLKLFSFATECLPFFIHAFLRAGERGLGRGANQGHGRFRLVSVHHEGHTVFDPGTERLARCAPRELAAPTLLPAIQESACRVRLVTPLRFKAMNHLALALPFSMLLTLIIRRLKSLWALDGRPFRLPEDDFAALRTLAACVRTEKNAIFWQDWSRYSNRQGSLMKLGGLSGEMAYAGPLDAFRGYLEFGRLAHIGKQTSFGLGALAIAKGGEDDA